jgi:hypothetical protein
MKYLCLVLFLIAIVLGCSAKTQKNDFIATQLNPAVTELYTQNSMGGFSPVCTATAFEQTDDIYAFVTAGHCVSIFSNHEQHKDDSHTFYVRVETENGVVMLEAPVLAIGCTYCGDDFAVLLVKTDIKLATVPLGKNPSELGEDVWNLAAPQGGGKNFFKGYVTNLNLNTRPMKKFPLNWEGYFQVDIPPTDGGSSGSAVVCANQKAICGILVGTNNYGKLTAAAPIERFIKWYAKALDAISESLDKP